MNPLIPTLLLSAITATTGPAPVTFTGPGGPPQLANSVPGNPLTLNFAAPDPSHQPTDNGFIVVEDSSLLLNSSPDTAVLTDSRPFHVGPDPVTVQLNMLPGGRFINAGVAPDPSVEFDVTASISGQASTAERTLGPLRGTAETVFQIPSHSAPITLQPGDYTLNLRAEWKASATNIPATVRAKFAAGRIEVFLTPVVSPSVDGVFNGASEGWVLVADDVKEVRSVLSGTDPRPWPIRIYAASDKDNLYFAVVQPQVPANSTNTGPVTVGTFKILWNTHLPQGDAAPDAELEVDVPSFSPGGGAGSADNIGILRMGYDERHITGDHAVKNQAGIGEKSFVEYRVPRSQLAGLDKIPYTYDSTGQGEDGHRNLGISANALADDVSPTAWATFDYRPAP
jgi:hypothetical protein